MTIVNRVTKKVISKHARYVNNLLKKVVDLFKKEEIEHDDAIILSPCKNVNMFFAKGKIDVIFVDKNNNICYLKENLGPWQFTRFVRKAKFAIELPAGKIREKRIIMYSNLQILAE